MTHISAAVRNTTEASVDSAPAALRLTVCGDVVLAFEDVVAGPAAVDMEAGVLVDIGVGVLVILVALPPVLFVGPTPIHVKLAHVMRVLLA